MRGCRLSRRTGGGAQTPRWEARLGGNKAGVVNLKPDSALPRPLFVDTFGTRRPNRAARAMTFRYSVTDMHLETWNYAAVAAETVPQPVCQIPVPEPVSHSVCSDG